MLLLLCAKNKIIIVKVFAKTILSKQNE